ncbi:hypothetical protein AB1L07_02280 [Niallia alba]|uniref:hypothetical protein n=1 Tax=Niallia alba TaxID=2729105 RepID=UPI0039A19604
MKLLQLGKGVYTYYTQTVKDNKNTSHLEVQKKLTRNMLLAQKLDSTGYPNQLYQYGCLCFTVSKTGVVKWIRNGCRPSKDWRLDTDRYKELNTELKINL